MASELWNKLFLNKSGMWTAIFTGLLTIFSALLWNITNEGSKTSVQTQRAFLNSGGIQITNDTRGESDKVKGVRIFSVWVNSGTTPTKAALTESNLALVDYTPQTANFDALPQTGPRQVVLGPKSAMQNIPVDISLADLESMSKGVKHAFVWGWVAYYDIFPDTPMRLTEYCVEINHPVWTRKDHTNPKVGVNFDTPPCASHNCYDENCGDYRAKVERLRAMSHNP